MSRRTQEKAKRGARIPGLQRHARAGLGCERSGDERELEARKPAAGRFDPRALVQGGASELEEDPLDLTPLLGSELRQPIAGEDDLARLDEERLARVRSVVDDPRDLAGVPRANREDDAPAATPRIRIGERGLDRGFREERTHGAVDLLVQLPHLPSDASQERRGLVSDDALLVEARLDPLAQGREIRHAAA